MLPGSVVQRSFFFFFHSTVSDRFFIYSHFGCIRKCVSSVFTIQLDLLYIKQYYFHFIGGTAVTCFVFIKRNHLKNAHSYN